MSTAAETDRLADLEFAKPCQSPDECDIPAAFAVWCDHHAKDCPYVGYRCHIHRNMLLLETRRLVDHLRSGGTAICGRCHAEIVGTRMEDHIRVLPL